MRSLAFPLLLLTALLFLPALAFADPASLNPVAQATSSVQTSWDLVTQYGPIWGGMLFGFGAVSYWLRKNQVEHWIAEGRALALITAGVGVFSAVLEAHFGNGSWAGVVATLFPAAKLLLNPTITKTPVAEGAKLAARSPLLLLLLILPFMTIASCSWTKSEAKTVETAAVDCTKGELGMAVKVFSPVLEQLIVLATGGDGHLDTAQLASGTKTLAGDIGGCVLTNAVAKSLKAKPAIAGSPQSSPLAIDPGELRAFYEAKREQLGGKTYVTEQGPL